MSHFSEAAPSRGTPDDLIIDIDGVALDYLEGFKVYAQTRLGRQIPGLPTDFNLTNWLGLENFDDTMALIEAFNGGADGGFANLKPLPYAKSVLQAMHNSGRAIHVITAIDPSPKVAELRRENLFNAFGDIFTDIHMVGFNQSKGDLLAQYHRGIWVEDKFENAVVGHQLGHRSYLMKAPINTKYKDQCEVKGVTWIDCWRDLARMEGLDAEDLAA
jgi:hypothetical protein